MSDDEGNQIYCNIMEMVVKILKRQYNNVYVSFNTLNNETLHGYKNYCNEYIRRA